MVELPEDNLSISAVPQNEDGKSEATFVVSVEGRMLKVTRTDRTHGWGQSLVLKAIRGGVVSLPDDVAGYSGTVRVFRQDFALEDAIRSHAYSIEANMRVTNGIPLGISLLLPVGTVNCVQTLQAQPH
jgi:hypothetical protein